MEQGYELMKEKRQGIDVGSNADLQRFDTKHDGRITKSELIATLKEFQKTEKAYKRSITIIICLIFAIIALLAAILGIDVWANELTKEVSTGGSDGQSFEETSTVSNQLIQASSSKTLLTATGFLSATIDDRDSSLYSYQMDDSGNRFDLFDYPAYLNNTPVTTYYGYGNISIDKIKAGCELMYDGYSIFTFRKELKSSMKTSLSNIEVISEACEYINSGNFTITVNSRYFQVYCEESGAGSSDICQIYELTYDIITYNESDSNYNASDRRRLAEACGTGGSVYVEGKGDAYCTASGSSWESSVSKFLFTGNPIIKIGSWLGSLVGATGKAIQETAGDCYYAQSSFNCPAYRCCPDTSCFPGSATVQVLNTPAEGVATTVTKQIKDVNIGDKVLSMNNYGKFEYSDVYINGHKIDSSDSKSQTFEYVYINTMSNDEIIATKDHFIYVCLNNDSCDFETSMLVKFQDVVPYKHYILVKDTSLSYVRRGYYVSMVISVTIKVENDGVYNPYTMNGNMIVNNVVASCHSSWIIDRYIPHEWNNYLPTIYQSLFSPVRLIYLYFPQTMVKLDIFHAHGLNDVSLATIMESLVQ